MGCLSVADSGVVQASCGHYVKRLGPGFVPGKAAAKAVAQLPAPHAAIPCGCRGPECGRAPLDHAPLSPTPPLRFTAQQELTAIAIGTLELTPDRGWLVLEFSGRPARGYPLGTTRPPCA